MSKSRDTVESIRTALLDADIGTSVLAPDGDGSNLTGLNAVGAGSTLPSNGAAAASLFFLTSNKKLYVSDGTIWNLVANQGPVPTGGTVVIPSVVESSGSYSYNLGIDFQDDQNTDGELTYAIVSGAIPTGAVMPTTGNSSFTGTIPTVSSTTLFTFQISATDTSNLSRTQNYQWTISNAVPITTGGTVTITGVDGGTAISYDVDTDFTFPASASFSAFSLQSGALPNGTTLNTSTGVISGTVLNSSATYTFTIRATDTDGDVSDQSYSWIVTYLATAATGGTLTTYGIYKVHTFVSSSSLNVTAAGDASILVIGGGGGGGEDIGGGGGAGAAYYRAAMPLSVSNYSITIGAGGSQNTNGSDTTAFGITAIGGGGGRNRNVSPSNSGSNGAGAGGDGNMVAGTGSITTYTGWTGHGGHGGGGIGQGHVAGGGGGAGGAGVPPTLPHPAGAGGLGHSNSINGTSLYWAGGGGGSGYDQAFGGNGGIGGGGAGASNNGATGTQYTGTGGGSALNAGQPTSPQVGSVSSNGHNAGVNTGSGGGGGTHSTGTGGSGGSGIVIVRYIA